ncbi:hypothetical protein ACLOJK_019960, partial [Asimina triloba]
MCLGAEWRRQHARDGREVCYNVVINLRKRTAALRMPQWQNEGNPGRRKLLLFCLLYLFFFRGTFVVRLERASQSQHHEDSLTSLREMAVPVMANDGEKPVFHDFFGATCPAAAAGVTTAAKNIAFRETRPPEASPSLSVGASSGGHGPVSASSDLGSERQAGKNCERVQFHGGKSELSGPEITNRFSGTKRSNSDSAFMASLREKMYQMGPDSVETARLIKMFHNEAGGDRSRRSKDDELYAPFSSRPELVVSNWDRSMPTSAGQMVHYPSRLGQFASNRYKDTSAGASLISQPAADEGSRTGIKGSGLASIINTSSGAAERNPTG